MHEKLIQQLGTIADLGQNSHYANNKLGFDSNNRITIEPNTLSRYFKKCDHGTIFNNIEEIYTDSKIICRLLMENVNLANGIANASGRDDLEFLMQYTLKMVKSLSGLDELILQYSTDAEYVLRVKKTRADLVIFLENIETVFNNKFPQQKINNIAMSDVFKFLTMKKI